MIFTFLKLLSVRESEEGLLAAADGEKKGPFFSQDPETWSSCVLVCPWMEIQESWEWESNCTYVVSKKREAMFTICSSHLLYLSASVTNLMLVLIVHCYTSPSLSSSSSLLSRTWCSASCNLLTVLSFWVGSKADRQDWRGSNHRRVGEIPNRTCAEKRRESMAILSSCWSDKPADDTVFICWAHTSILSDEVSRSLTMKENADYGLGPEIDVDLDPLANLSTCTQNRLPLKKKTTLAFSPDY